jgi:small subunit ribosomal protein S18
MAFKPGMKKGPRTGGFGFKRIKKKKCRFCTAKINVVDYKNSDFLKGYLTERNKVVPRRVNGNCARHQRMLSRGIKKSREAGFLPYTIE